MMWIYANVKMISRSMTVELMTDQDGSVLDAQPDGKHGTTSPTIMKVEKDPRGQRSWRRLSTWVTATHHNYHMVTLYNALSQSLSPIQP